MKNLTLILLIIGLVSFSGCNSGTGGTPKYNPYTGSKGITMSFAKNSPPQEIYEGQTFNVMVNAVNEGAESVKNGKMLLGYEEGIIEPEQPDQSFDLYGRAEARDKGEQKIINFRAKAKKLDPQVEVMETLMSVTTCYQYRTKFSGDVCVDTDPLKLRFAEKNCAAKDISSSGQGAPVRISKVEVEMIPHQDQGKIIPSFKITIANGGDGIVYNKDKINQACSAAEISKDDINTIYVKEARLGQDYYLDCKPKREGYDIAYVKLKEDESVIRCSYEPGIDANTAPFTAPLYLELEYGYSQTITQTALVKKEVY